MTGVEGTPLLNPSEGLVLSESTHNSLKKASDSGVESDVQDGAYKRENGLPPDGVQDLQGMSKEELISAYKELGRVAADVKKENVQLKESEEKLRSQQSESSRRENVLVMRLSSKEQELQDYVAQLNELKQSIAPSSSSLKNSLIDPAVNVVIQRMRKELEDTRKKLEDTQNDLNAWKFTPDSNTGKRLMAKCRMLYQENEDLGKMITSGRLAKLESDLALQRSLTEEMKKSQSELDELIQELDEDVEGMQGTIYYLQQELKNAKAEPPNANPPTPSTSLKENREELEVTLTVKITDLCEQCQVTHMKKRSPLKMEVGDNDTLGNENDRTIYNGEHSNSSPSSVLERLSPDEIPSASSISTNSNNAERTTRNSVTNCTATDILDSNLASDSENSKQRRTGGGGGSEEDSNSNPCEPPTKRTKLTQNSSNISSNKSGSQNGHD